MKGHQARIGSLFCTFFTDREVVDYASAKTSDTKRYGRFFHGMLDRGVYLAPSQFEVGFRLFGAHRTRHRTDIAGGDGGGESVMKIVVAMTGASGAIYTQRLLDNLDPKAHEIHFISTKHAREVGATGIAEGRIEDRADGDPIRRERVDVCPVRQRVGQI